MTAWASEQCQIIEELLAERIDGWLEAGERLEVSGDSSPDATEVRFVLEGRAAGDRLVLEARVDHEAARLAGDAARDLAIDALDLLLLDHLEAGREQRFSGVWEGRELRGKPLQVRIERTFPDLEARADALLTRPGANPDEESGAPS